MIKTAIATAAVTATTVSAFAAGHAKDHGVTVYGRLNVAAVCTDIDDDDCNIGNNGSRFGIKASSEVSDGLTAFAKYEFATDLNNGGKEEATRLGFVGLKGGFGEVSMGTRWNPMYNHTVSPIDAPNLSGGTSAPYGVTALTPYRVSNTLNYKNKFGAAAVGVQLGMGDGGKDLDSFTIGTSIPVGSATIGLAYASDENSDVDATSIHARTKFGAVGVGATYITTDDVDGVLLALNYGMGGGKGLNLTYGQNMIDGGGDPTSIGLEYLHNMGGGFKWYAGFESNDSDGAGTDYDEYGVGMRYDF